MLKPTIPLQDSSATKYPVQPSRLSFSTLPPLENASSSRRLPTQETPQQGVSRPVAEMDCSTLTEPCPSSVSTSTYLGQENAIDKLLISRPSLKRGDTFARLAPPRLTITPIITTPPSPIATQMTKNGVLTSTTASKALRAVSDSKLRKKLTRRASLPGSIHSRPPQVSSEIPQSTSAV